MTCAVCGKGIEAGQACFANAWEKTRKLFPCCGAACAQAFDPDQHWIPAVMPVVATGDRAVELRHLASKRLRALDEARPVVRELLQVGADPADLRVLVTYTGAKTVEGRRQNLLANAVRVLFGGLRRARADADTRSKQSFALANQDLDQWIAERRRRDGKPA